ncbi:DNA-nicking endonuclease, Smr domain [Devosia enhydra]|uniref:DNA-nicking endonuclease, Smr domain n=1 Tax=Devosia enhydra TaxID=665118 RepID=A0A1K2HYW3_9HYPH|nr:DNA-nicking endonuclease, Smr domain [Devosia enhydra]
MSKRGPARPSLPDWHLWSEVARSITPLRFAAVVEPEPAAELTLPIPEPVARKAPPRFTRIPKAPFLPPYRPDHPSAQTPPGTVIEPKLKKKLGRGRIGIDARIDLHGMRQSEAHAALSRFIHARAARGDRTLLVITGKGGRVPLRDEDLLVSFERGVLRGMLPIWLSSPDLAPLVAGWDSAVQGHGGDGAFYVRLKAPGRIAPGRVKP